MVDLLHAWLIHVSQVNEFLMHVRSSKVRVWNHQTSLYDSLLWEVRTNATTT